MKEGEDVVDFEVNTVGVEVVERVGVFVEVVVEDWEVLAVVVLDTVELPDTELDPFTVRVALVDEDTVLVEVPVFVREEEPVTDGEMGPVGDTLPEPLTGRETRAERVARGELEEERVGILDTVESTVVVEEKDIRGDFVEDGLGVLDGEYPADMVPVRVRVVEGDGGALCVAVRVFVEVCVAAVV